MEIAKTQIPLFCALSAIPAMKVVPRCTSSSPTSVTLEFAPAIPAAGEYRLEYSENGSTDYEEGKRVQHSNESTFRLTQGGLKPNTRYWFRIVPYVQGIRGLESPHLTTSTGKDLFVSILTQWERQGQLRSRFPMEHLGFKSRLSQTNTLK